MSNEHVHHLKYEIKLAAVETPDTLATAEATLNENLGFCDGLIVGQTIEYASGGYSQIWHSYNGRNELKPLSGDDEFKFWILMAKDIADKKDLDVGKREFARGVFNSFCKAMAMSMGTHAEKDEQGR